MSQNVSVEQQCNAVLAQPCPYTKPPLMFVGGHEFCPCVCKAIRAAYIGGYKAGKAGETPEVGVDDEVGREPNRAA